MSYHTYNLLLAQLERIMWRTGHLKYKKKQRGLDTMRETMREILINQPDMYKTIDLPIIMEEYMWLQNRQVIFPENDQLVKRLLKASAKIKRPDLLFRNDIDNFILALPKSFKIHKIDSTGILVQVAPWHERQELTDNFFDWVSLPRVENNSTSTELAICITYNMPNQSREIKYRAVIPISWVNGLLNAKNGHEYNQILGNFDKTKIVTGFDLSALESEYQQVIVKLVLAILLYKKTNPDKLKPGYPTIKRPKFEGITIKKTNDQTLFNIVSHESPTAHYRSWCFKQLIADRYYQGEYSDWQKGSRIIFVRDTFVNVKDVDPATLVK